MSLQLEPRKFLAPEYIFGVGSRFRAASYCRKYGAKNVLLVTDACMMKTAWFRELTEGLASNGIPYVVYADFSPNPRDHEVAEGSRFYLEEQCDLILALGGGSVVDGAKGIGIVATNRLSIDSYEGVDRVSRPIPPLIAIPTTSGASADVSQFAIINNTSEHYKMAIISKALVPDVSLIDPLVLTSMDAYLTACTGMDALAHAMEAFVSNANSAFTDLYASEAIRLVNTHLSAAISHPEDLQVRGQLMLASLYAGLAFSNASLGSVHALAHSLGGYLDLPHGECNALLLPHVMRYNFSSTVERYRAIAGYMDLPVKGMRAPEVEMSLFDHLLKLQRSLDLAPGLGSRGVKPDITPVLADKAIADPCNATNPRSPDRNDLVALYNEAL